MVRVLFILIAMSLNLGAAVDTLRCFKVERLAEIERKAEEVKLAQAQGKNAQAEPLYKRSLAIREKALGPDHPNMAKSLENLAALYRATNRDEEAEKLEQRAARIRAIKR